MYQDPIAVQRIDAMVSKGSAQRKELVDQGRSDELLYGVVTVRSSYRYGVVTVRSSYCEYYSV